MVGHFPHGSGISLQGGDYGGRGAQPGLLGRVGGNVARQGAERGEAHGMRPGELFVQGWVDAGTEDFGETERGEAQEARMQGIGLQSSGKFGREGDAAAGRHAGEIHHDGAGEIAEADLAGEFGDHGAVGSALGGFLVRARSGARARVDIDGDQGAGRLDVHYAAPWDGHGCADQSIDFGLNRFGKGGRYDGKAGAELGAQGGSLGVAVDQDGCGRILGGKALEGAGATAEKRWRGAAIEIIGLAMRGAQTRAFAGLGGTGDLHGEGAARCLASGAAAVGEEAFCPGDGDEGAGHGGDASNDAGAVDVAHAIRGAGAVDGIVDHRVAIDHHHADFAGGTGGENPGRHGMCQPAPRSSCAVSYKGKPTTLE